MYQEYLSPSWKNTRTTLCLPKRFQDFKDYIQSMPHWINNLISNFTTNPLSETWVHYIQQQNPPYISTDGSRINKKSGGSWIISLSDGTAIVLGWNPDFGQIPVINSYYSEIYVPLASLTVIKWYCNSFYLRIFNPIETCCDNESYVNKLNELQSNTYSKLFIQKLKEYETYLELINIFPKKIFRIVHLKTYPRYARISSQLPLQVQAIITDKN